MPSISSPTAAQHHGLPSKQDHIVTLEQYDLQQPSAQQNLTPLDMNMPRLYGIRLVLCFPLFSGTDKLQVFENLKEGLAHTIMSIPWIAGVIGPEVGQDPKNRRIQILDSPSGFVFPYKDLTEVLPSYQDLKERNFPLSEFPTAQLGPIDAIPQSPHQPVFVAQANFVKGGLLLAVGVHHSACDAAALDAILSTWSHNTAVASDKAKSFSTFDETSNDRNAFMDRKVGADVDLNGFPEYMLMPTPESTDGVQGMGDFKMPPLSSHLFRFSPEALGKLKADAAAFSSHDALCAFVWQRMTLARCRAGVFANPPTDAEVSRLCFSVNIRNRMSPPLPPSYLGNASMACVTERMAVDSITSESGIPQAVAAIRKSLNEFNGPSRVDSTLALLTSRPDPTDFKLAFHGFLGPDVVETSWADLEVYEHKWGAFGDLDAVRVPSEGSDGVIMLLPRLKDGGLDVVIGLATGAMEKLLEDEKFTSVTQS
ncbi:hypothetical protein F53441_8338 [Fusarium austroafricanum]|uniref:Trichothecene 3-O-acetyltransferase n=1 Tax=Fusarium austroafricanum TaxID=2364996 RepID=A0A8H4NXG3_9HYPO|nr:hypothetical protein F53441_8338 [Fusarium austroafricanum]